jgi:hypothetical protein
MFVCVPEPRSECSQCGIWLGVLVFIMICWRILLCVAYQGKGHHGKKVSASHALKPDTCTFILQNLDSSYYKCKHGNIQILKAIVHIVTQYAMEGETLP